MMRRANDTALRLACAALAVLLPACAPGTGMQAPGPQEIPALEAQYRAAPGNEATRARLAAAYRAADRPADAVALLEPVAGQAGPTTAVTLAGAYEDLDRFADARTIYTRLESTTSGRLQREVRSRLLALNRLELEHAVQRAIEREDSLRAVTPPPNTIGVFPFLFASSNQELAPLSRALAELLTVDLAQTSRLRVVERARIQYLLDEMAFGESARVDTTTAARAGRLVGAGRIVQGRIDGAGDQVQLVSLLVGVGTPEGARQLEEGGPLSQLFDIEKQLALDIYEAAGIQLTAAERERVNRRQTENVQALLAFGYGLEAADAGNYQAAIEQFDRARDLDPGFALAQDWLTRTQAEFDFQQQGTLGLMQIAGGGAGTTTTGVDPDAPEWLQIRQRFADIELIIPNPQTRDAIPEVLGVEGLDRGAILELIIRRPAAGGAR